MRARILFSLLGGLPLLLLANSSNPPIRKAGVPSDDGGLTCTVCHQNPSAMPGVLGSVALNITTYTPGQTQLLHVTIQDPQASRWGFQMTARPLNDTTQEAGTFTPVDGTVTVRCDDGSTIGSAAPCTGKREFAEQIAAATGSNGSATFSVNWTPPVSEVGAIAFYVAAVAANGDNSAGGDRTYTLVQKVTAVGACNNNVTPAISVVEDAAGFSSNLASGGLWTIKGLNFEPSNLKRTAGVGDLVNGAFPTELGCIAVRVNGQPAPITYVQTDQINFQGPATVGPASIVVVSNPGPSEVPSVSAANVTILPVAPAFFTFNGSSIAAQIAGTTTIVANPSVVPGARPVRPGEYVTLYGTGFGATNPAVAPGAVATGISNVTAPVVVMIGGTTVAASDVQYVGLSPGSISGLYQINVRIPNATPSGDVSVVVTVGGVQSQAGATIPVAAL